MKHKHAELIKAWADGAKIEYFSTYEDKWDLCVNNNPCWVLNTKYRVAPTPKPDVVKRYYATPEGHYTALASNLQLIFDGETRKLKAAEVIE